MPKTAAVAALEVALDCSANLTARLMSALVAAGSLPPHTARDVLLDAADGVTVPLQKAEVDSVAMRALERYAEDLRDLAAAFDNSRLS